VIRAADDGTVVTDDDLCVPNTRPVLDEERWRRVVSRVVGEWARRSWGSWCGVGRYWEFRLLGGTR